MVVRARRHTNVLIWLPNLAVKFSTVPSRFILDSFEPDKIGEYTVDDLEVQFALFDLFVSARY